MSAFAKRLSDGLDVVLGSRVISLEDAAGAFRATDERGETHSAPSLVVALPASQALDMLATVGGPKTEKLSALRHLLASASAARCLTVIADYASAKAPDWEMVYPEESRVLQAISHDSSKRPGPSRTIVVLQALPAWSRMQWEAGQDVWTEAMLADAARQVGDWAAAPEVVQPHRWRFAYLSGGGDLTSPFSVVFDDGTRIGCAGEAFAPGGGIQAAWRSGRQLAERWTRRDSR
jgi:predicted NAD/FAD-dependent oxidoreductase